MFSTRYSHRNVLRTTSLAVGALAPPAWADEKNYMPSDLVGTQQMLVRAGVEIARVRPELHSQFGEHLHPTTFALRLEDGVLIAEVPPLSVATATVEA